MKVKSGKMSVDDLEQGLICEICGEPDDDLLECDKCGREVCPFCRYTTDDDGVLCEECYEETEETFPKCVTCVHLRYNGMDWTCPNNKHFNPFQLAQSFAKKCTLYIKRGEAEK